MDLVGERKWYFPHTELLVVNQASLYHWATWKYEQTGLHGNTKKFIEYTLQGRTLKLHHH